VLEGVFAERVAAVADRHQQGGRRTAVQQSGQLGELVRRLLVLLAALLLEDEPGDVMGDGHDRAQRQRRGEPVGDHGGQLLVEQPDGGRVQPLRAGDDAGPVAMGQQRAAVGAGPAGQPVLPGLAVAGWAHPGGHDDRVGHPVQQLLLAAQVPVQRR
jgi:hypothetical protein